MLKSKKPYTHGFFFHIIPQIWKCSRPGGAFNTHRRNFWIHGQEVGNYPSPNSPQPDLPCFPRRYQTQVHRESLNIGTTSLPSTASAVRKRQKKRGIGRISCTGRTFESLGLKKSIHLPVI